MRGSTPVRGGLVWSPAELVGAAALVGIVVVGCVAWSGAAVAARAAGHPFTADLRDALPAASRLPGTLGDPRAAWPPEVQHELPGAPLYWGGTVAVLGVLLAGATGVVVAVRRMTPVRKRLGVDVRARFATRRELRPLLIRRPQSGRFVVGRYGRHLVATQNRTSTTPRGRTRRRSLGDITSVAIVGPSRSGKTAECAIPGVLDWDGPAILLSVKRDLLDATIRRRRRLGAVRVFDPAGLVTTTPLDPSESRVAIEPHELARWSPLREAHTPAGAKKAGQALAAWTPKAGIEGGGDFWAHSGKILFTGLLGAAAIDPTGPSMAKLARWVFEQDQPKPAQPSEVHTVLAASADVRAT